jgi:tetratricopeptide (TPR) repeat protein
MMVFALIGLTSRAGFANDEPSKGDASVALRSARLYLKQQLWDKAQEQLEIAVTGDSMNPEAHFLLGTLHGDRDSVDLMNRHFHQAIQLKPGKYDKDIQAWREKAWTQHYNNGVRAIQKDKLEEALKEFFIAVRADSTRADGYKSLGLTYLRMDRTDLGIASYQKAVGMDPKDKNAYVNLGIAYHNARQPEKEVEAFEVAARLDPKSADVMAKLVMGYEALATTTQDSGKAAVLYDSAMAACERALALDPKNARIAVTAGRLHLNRAMLYTVAGKKADATASYGQAEKYLKAALELDPKDVSSAFNLGICYGQMERPDDAIAMFRKAVEIDSTDIDSWVQLGVTQVRQKDLDGAIETFKKVTEIKPDHVRAYEFLASVYAQKDMPKEAKVAYDAAEALKGKGKE